MHHSDQRLGAWTGGHFGPGKLGFFWSKDYQAFHADGAVYAHDGVTTTEPSHDLAHLLIAANGRMPWHPIGEDGHVRLAEYNAVFLENILCKAFEYVVDRTVYDKETILIATINHLRWFVEEHYAPFPVPAEEIYRMFCWNIEPKIMSRLSPIFFDLRQMEKFTENYKERSISILFYKNRGVRLTDKKKEFSDVVFEVISRISARQVRARNVKQ